MYTILLSLEYLNKKKIQRCGAPVVVVFQFGGLSRVLRVLERNTPTHSRRWLGARADKFGLHISEITLYEYAT